MSKNTKLIPALIGAAAVTIPALYAAYQFYGKKDPKQAHSDGREILPANVRPFDYSVELNPNFDFGKVVDGTNYTYEGKVVIKLAVNTTSNTITMHAKDLDFTAADCKLSNNTGVIRVVFDKKEETATLHLGSSLRAGSKCDLSISFTGNMNDQLHGFYRSTYTKDGEKRVMGTTQFEATHCREAFPCWDEPEIKATFEIILIVPRNRVALSNMPVVSEEELSGNKKRITYDRTPKVSSYLLAWVIGEFDYVETKTSSGTLVRVYTQEGITEQGEFALDTAVKVLDFFTEFFDIAYPLPKMDMIAIPDFAAGAMENWGLVTYRETALLFDPKTSSASAKERVAYVVAHELAHQWFGNLVSPDWWKYLWLNEGFATWAGQLAIAELFPDWSMWTKFVSSYVANAFKADGLASSHPIEVEVKNSGAISEIFDAISYYKGSSVIRMLANYLGHETFRDGLRTYLKAKAYSCASTEDLWEHCSRASGKDVAGLMDNWIKKTGYPYVTVEEVTAAQQDTITIKLSQRLFLATGVTDNASAGEPVWQCPVNVMVGFGDTSTTQLLELRQRSQIFTVKLPAGVTASDPWWLKANTNTSSFFRVKYDENLLNRLVPVLASLASPIDRMSVQNDVFALAEAGALSTVNGLELAAGYINETDYSIWSDLSSSLSALRYLYQAEKVDFADQFNSYLCTLYSQITKTVGWEPKEGESQTTTLLRTLVIAMSGKSGNAETIKKAKEYFSKQMNGTGEVPVDLRSAVYAIALGSGGRAEYDTLVGWYNATDSQEERVRILQALGAAPTPELLSEYLAFGLTDKVRSQDTIYCVSSVAANPKGRDLAYAWFKDNWATIFERYGTGQFMLANFLNAVCGRFATEEKLQDITMFFEGKELPGAERKLSQVKEQVGLRSRRLQRDINSDISKVLAKHSN